MKELAVDVGFAVLLLVFLVLIGALVVTPGPSEGKHVRRAMMRESLDKIVTTALDFHSQEGRFPDSLGELTRWHAWDETLPPEERLPALDPYGNEWKYEVRGDRIKVCSYGGDGLPGGEGSSEDMVAEGQAGHSE